MQKNTILNQEITIATNPDEAWYSGNQYFLAAEAEAYKNFSTDHLAALLRSAAKLQNDTGHIQLFEDSTMPMDARVDIIYKPSYAVAAIAIYAQQNCPNIFDAELSDMFHNLLEGAFAYGIIGHGIDHEETVRRTMLMLCKAGLHEFVNAHKAEFPVFTTAISRHMEHFLDLAKRINEDKIIVTANGFSRDSINHLIKQLVAYWNGNTHPLFVYGTLMKGERANHMLSNNECAGFFQLKNYTMYNLGAYPGIKPCAGESVLGELYFVNDEIIAQLDEYEEEGSLYKRETVQIEAGPGKLSAEVYIYNRNVIGSEKMREKWNAHDGDLVWYAGYGSNLSSERFACYISGGTCAENGRTYSGSSDPTPPRAEMKCSYPGRLYFGNNSSSWNGCGVAFFDPYPNDRDELVYMKRYLITRRQLHDIMAQEGKSANWYGRIVCLEIDNLGIPVYTLTSETPRPQNEPAHAYKELIYKVLQDEFKLKKRQAMGYLSRGLD